ncbi:MAG: acyltransferase [Acidimicrobiales bacterium]|nr:acyltransferase [Acidimicrobiales bacterium]
MTDPEAGRKRIPGLDGLRAIAVVAVLAYHAGFRWASGGYLGVSQFFTLSGFLVGGLLLRERSRSGAIALSRFWARRFRRLLPAASLGILLAAVYAGTAGTLEQASALPRQAFAAALYVSNWQQIGAHTGYASIFQQPSPVQHYWSLSIEEQFYLAAPLVILALFKLLRSRAPIAAVLAVSTFAAAVWTSHMFGSGVRFDRVYFGTGTRMAEILGGVAFAALAMSRPMGAPFASLRTRRVVGWCGAVALALSVWTMHAVVLESTILWRGGMLLFTFATIAVIAGVLADVGPLCLLSRGPLPLIGRISYGIYVYHWPVFLWIDEERTGLSPWPLFAVRLAVTGVLALASFRFVEEPVLEGLSLGLPRLARWACVPTAIAVVVATSFVVAHVRPSPPPKTFGAEKIADAPSANDDPTLDVLVLADASGRSVAAELKRKADQDPGLDVTVGPEVVCRSIVNSHSGRICSDWNEKWPALVRRVDPDVVLLFYGGPSEEDLRRMDPAADPFDLAREVLSSAVDVLGERGAPTVWSAPSPDLAGAVQREREPFFRAVRYLFSSDSRLRKSDGIGRPTGPDDRKFASSAAATLLGNLRANRRRTGGDAGRVMVVGDSQAQSLAFGLARWSEGHSGPVVWDAALGGCGVVGGGSTIGIEGNSLAPPSAGCNGLVEEWGRGVRRFQPDRILVWTSLRDLQPRKLEGWGDVRFIGDAEFDAHVLSSYVKVVDALSVTGARITWIVPPCIKRVVFGYDGRGSPFDTESIDHLRDVIIPELVKKRPRIDLYDMGDLLCPDDVFREKVAGVGALRPDGLHLSANSAAWVANEVGPELLDVGR